MRRRVVAISGLGVALLTAVALAAAPGTSARTAAGATHAIGSGARSAAQIAAERSALEGFDAFVEQVMKDWKVPGLAVAVVRDGKALGPFPSARWESVRRSGRPWPVMVITLALRPMLSG